MSTEFAMEFGQEYGNEYGRILGKWSKKLFGVDKITDELFAEWGSDLHDVLNEQIHAALLKEVEPTISGTKPSNEELAAMAEEAVKGALVDDTRDLLERLRISSNEALTAAPFSPVELIKRASQTVAQIFDMAQDRFRRAVNTFSGKTRRRWETHSPHSRHAALDGQVKDEGELFTYDGEEVYGPRPPGGAPARWSNCSCTLTYIK